MSTPSSQDPGSEIGWYNDETGDWDKAYPTPSRTTPPLTPYAGTSGHSGTDTSEARARRDDSDGTTSRRQREILASVGTTGTYGVTVKDLREVYPRMHHGQVSSALSVLHKEGFIARLEEKRDRCHVYVATRYVMDRPTQKHGRNKPHPVDAMRARIETVLPPCQNFAGSDCDTELVGENPAHFPHCLPCIIRRAMNEEN